MSKNEKKIQEYRKQIDKYDSQILELLNNRAKTSLEIRKVKQDNGSALYDPKREEEILRSLCKQNEGPIYDDNIREIFTTIMRINRGL